MPNFGLHHSSKLPPATIQDQEVLNWSRIYRKGDARSLPARLSSLSPKAFLRFSCWTSLAAAADDGAEAPLLKSEAG